MTTTNRLISISEAGHRYGISRQTIYRFIKDGKLDLIKIGRASRLNLTAADDAFGLSRTPGVE
jgi:excisionase family DNA binding protein